MEIDISIGSESMTVNIGNPHKSDLAHVEKTIIDFGMKFGIDLTALKTERLVSRMVKGVAGCEGGCPADAKDIVRQGFGDFSLSYTEGGILSAVHILENGKHLNIKIFPEFD